MKSILILKAFYSIIVKHQTNGGVAQLVRVPASHAGGPGFEPQRVHQTKTTDWLLQPTCGFFVILIYLFTAIIQ